MEFRQPGNESPFPSPYSSSSHSTGCRGLGSGLWNTGRDGWQPPGNSGFGVTAGKPHNKCHPQPGAGPCSKGQTWHPRLGHRDTDTGERICRCPGAGAGAGTGPEVPPNLPLPQPALLGHPKPAAASGVIENNKYQSHWAGY